MAISNERRIMKTSKNQFQQLLAEATALYHSEKEITAMLSLLHSGSLECTMKEWIAIEEEENKRHCERLEGFLVVLNQVGVKNSENKELLSELSFILKRVTSKHAGFGYKTGILPALGKMEVEMKTQVRELLQRASSTDPVKAPIH